MGRFSKSKGKRGERELAAELCRVLGVTARRGVQFQGSPDSPDVVTSIPNVHIECKRSERFRLYDALEQAIDDAGTEQIPIVCHRQNNKPWVIVVRLDDLPKLVDILHDNTDTNTNEPETDSTEYRSAIDQDGPEHASKR
jgi:Holliday junction resolvase